MRACVLLTLFGCLSSCLRSPLTLFGHACHAWLSSAARACGKTVEVVAHTHRFAGQEECRMYYSNIQPILGAFITPFASHATAHLQARRSA